MPFFLRAKLFWGILSVAVLGMAPSAFSTQAPFFEIQAQPLEKALLDFAEVAQISIDFSGLDLKTIPSRGTQNHISKEASLRAILAGTGLMYRFVGPNSVQIYQPQESPASPKTDKLTKRPDIIENLTITATKRPETNFALPISVSGVSALTLEDLDAFDLQSLAPYLAGVSTTNLGPGRNKIFLRGLSDGPFSDRTQSMVGVYIDETPINFNDTNPDIRLFDVERVELVRGPQGTLYGSGSLGGLYRIISKKPNLKEHSGAVRLGASYTEGGGPNSILDAVFNAPIIANSLGFRISAYADMRDGYIDDTLQKISNVNKLEIYGIRPALRWRLSPNWTLDATGTYQSIRYDDSQYYFEDQGRNKRNLQIQEPYDDTFLQAGLTLKGKLGSMKLTSATALVKRSLKETSDASSGQAFLDTLDGNSDLILFDSGLSELADEMLTKSPLGKNVRAYFTHDDILTFSQETRLHGKLGPRIQWLFGLYFLHRKQSTRSLLAFGSDTPEINVFLADRRKETTQDTAFFGEMVYQTTKKLSFTGGLRYSRNSLKLEYRSRFVSGVDEQNIIKKRLTNKVIPKIAVRYEWSKDIQNYAQISVGYRVGGININTPLEALAAAEPDEDIRDKFNSRAFQSDNLVNYEIGLKSYWLNRDLSFNISAFYVQWSNIQSDQIGASGLPFVTNIGEARSLGYEIEFFARPLQNLELRGSFFWNESKLSDDNVFLQVKAGDRLPTIPENTASIAALYQFNLSTNWTATASVDYRYIGKSKLSFSEATSAPMGDYGILNAKIQFIAQDWKLGLYAKNLTDSQANTFAFGNGFSFRQRRQITPPQPRTFGIFIERQF